MFQILKALLNPNSGTPASFGAPTAEAATAPDVKAA